MKKIQLYLVAIGLVVLYSSCTQKIYKEYNLFQKGLDSLKNYEYKTPLVQNNDQLNVQIYSATLSQEQVSVFNMGGASSSNSSSALAGAGSNSNASGGQNYVVDINGMISIPIIGAIKSEGKTTDQIAKEIKAKLEAYVKEPVVSVRLAGIKINVLGAVKHPGIINFTSLNPTLIDAISQAGDFEDGAKRKEVYLIRDVNGKRTSYKLNFIDDAAVFNAEVFQLIQNDLIYVPANDEKLKNINQDQDVQRKIQVAQLVIAGIGALSVMLNTYLIFKRL